MPLRLGPALEKAGFSLGIPREFKRTSAFPPAAHLGPELLQTRPTSREDTMLFPPKSSPAVATSEKNPGEQVSIRTSEWLGYVPFHSEVLQRPDLASSVLNVGFEIVGGRTLLIFHFVSTESLGSTVMPGPNRSYRLRAHTGTIVLSVKVRLFQRSSDKPFVLQTLTKNHSISPKLDCISIILL